MARNLYRFYLYAVFLVMLILAAVGLGWLLQPLLALTALRGTYSQPPTNVAIVQGVVFFGISWLIAGLLGGFHYWLIRRDEEADPDAGNRGIRSFFLNVTELIAAPLGIGLLGEGVISQLGQAFSGDLSYTAAVGLSALALFIVLELERRRLPASSGVALFFQRLHLYGVQFILLNILVVAWTGAFTILVNTVAFGGQASGVVPCSGFVACSNGPNLVSALASALWVALFWLGYGWLARNDAPSLFRRIALAISFAYGIALLLGGVYQALALLLRHLFGAAPSSADTLSGYNFSSFITLGLLVSATYLFWLRIPSRQQPAQQSVVSLISQAVIATLMAVAFFWGAGYALLNLFEFPATPVAWASALSLVITGAAYIVFDMRLARSKRENAPGAVDAQRGFFFAMIGAAIVAAAIGAAVALYAYITSLLGSPLDNWPHISNTGAAAFIVGAIVLVLYLLRARRERIIVSLARRPLKLAPVGAAASPAVIAQVPAPTTPQQEPPVAETAAPGAPEEATPGAQVASIEDILDDLLAGRLTRDQAASRIRQLSPVDHE